MFFFILFLISLYCNAESSQQKLYTYTSSASKHIIAKSNPSTPPSNVNLLSSSSYYPSQIININFKADSNYDCDALMHYISTQLFGGFFENYVNSSYGISCPFDKDMPYTLKGYFEPDNDKANEFLNKRLAELEGSPFFGTNLHFETSKKIIYNLIFEIGNKSSGQSFEQFYFKTNTFQFTSQKQARDSSLGKLYENFTIINLMNLAPFINQFFYLPEEDINYLLHKSNYLQLHTSKAFLYGKNMSDMLVEPEPDTPLTDIVVIDCADNGNQSTCL